MHNRTAILGSLVMLGGSLLVVGAALIDLGWFVNQPVLASLGNALSALAGIGLICLPLGLRVSGIAQHGRVVTVGVVCLVLGTSIVSLVDVPAIFNPTNLAAGGAFGPLGLVFLSIGFLAWFTAIHRAHSLTGWRKWIFLLAGVWLFISFPTIQLPLFVIPNGQPLFLLLAGVFGALQVLMGSIIRERGGTTAPMTV